MSETAITLNLPDHIYEQANRIAQVSGQPIESVIVETLTMLVDQPLALPRDTSHLNDYTDAQLWGVVYRRLPDNINQRWQDLLKQRQERALTDPEDAELAHFIEMNDHYMLHRSQALLILKQRGYDVDSYLNNHYWRQYQMNSRNSSRNVQNIGANTAKHKKKL